jgi:hypothetical protein
MPDYPASVPGILRLNRSLLTAIPLASAHILRAPEPRAASPPYVSILGVAVAV